MGHFEHHTNTRPNLVDLVRSHLGDLVDIPILVVEDCSLRAMALPRKGKVYATLSLALTYREEGQQTPTKTNLKVIVTRTENNPPRPQGRYTFRFRA